MARRYASCKFDSFCRRRSVDFLLDCADGAIYVWLLGDEELCSRRVASDFERFFRALASIGIARLSKKAVPCAEKIAKFVQAGDDKALEFWRGMAEI